MALFKVDPVASLTKAEADLATTMARLEELAAQRPALLLQDDMAPLDAADREAATLRAAAVRLGERIHALEAECRRLDLERRQRARDQAIAAVAKRLEPMAATAVELEHAITRMAALYFKLIKQRDDAMAVWPAELPLRSVTDMSVSDLAAEMGAALYRASWSPTGGHASAYEVRYRQFTDGIAGCCKRQAELLLQRLRGEVLADVADLEAA